MPSVVWGVVIHSQKTKEKQQKKLKLFAFGSSEQPEMSIMEVITKFEVKISLSHSKQTNSIISHQKQSGKKLWTYGKIRTLSNMNLVKISEAYYAESDKPNRILPVHHSHRWL